MIDEMDAQSLQEELDHYRSERDKVRAIVGQIGGKASAARDKVLNTVFIVLVLSLFAGDLMHYFNWIKWLPTMVSMEMALLLVSMKIIWMIHQQARVEHFQFWILNSIEFRLTEMGRRIGQLKDLSDKPAGPGE